MTQDPQQQAAFAEGRFALVRFGWTPQLEAAFAALPEPGFSAARVAGAQREVYTLWTAAAVLNAAVSGKLRHVAERGELPVVGDWVAVRQEPGESVIIHELLPRHTTLARQRAGRSQERQVLAANCDVVFIVSSLNLDWNPRRIERALALVQTSGANVVLILTKLDLCPDPSAPLAAAAQIAPGIPVHAISMHERVGLDALAPYLIPGQTIALIGSSGVGKSTLVNALLANGAPKPARFERRTIAGAIPLPAASSTHCLAARSSSTLRVYASSAFSMKPQASAQRTGARPAAAHRGARGKVVARVHAQRATARGTSIRPSPYCLRHGDDGASYLRQSHAYVASRAKKVLVQHAAR